MCVHLKVAGACLNGSDGYQCHYLRTKKILRTARPCQASQVRPRHQLRWSKNRAQRCIVGAQRGESEEICNGERMRMGAQPSPRITLWRSLGKANQHHQTSTGRHVRWTGQDSADTRATYHADGWGSGDRQRKTDICTTIWSWRSTTPVPCNAADDEDASSRAFPRSVLTAWPLCTPSLEASTVPWRPILDKVASRVLAA